MISISTFLAIISLYSIFKSVNPEAFIEWCEEATERRRYTLDKCSQYPFVYPYPDCYCLNGIALVKVAHDSRPIREVNFGKNGCFSHKALGAPNRTIELLPTEFEENDTLIGYDVLNAAGTTTFEFLNAPSGTAPKEFPNNTVVIYNGELFDTEEDYNDGPLYCLQKVSNQDMAQQVRYYQLYPNTYIWLNETCDGGNYIDLELISAGKLLTQANQKCMPKCGKYDVNAPTRVSTHMAGFVEYSNSEEFGLEKSCKPIPNQLVDLHKDLNERILKHSIERSFYDQQSYKMDYKPSYSFKIMELLSKITLKYCRHARIPSNFLEQALDYFKVAHEGRGFYFSEEFSFADYNSISRMLRRCLFYMNETLQFTSEGCGAMHNIKSVFRDSPKVYAKEVHPSATHQYFDHHVVLDIPWNMLDLANVVCVNAFSKSYRMYHLMEQGIEKLFTNELRSFWLYPDVPNFYYENLYGPYWRSFARNLEKCVDSAYMYNPKMARLVRPQWIPGNQRSSRRRGTLVDPVCERRRNDLELISQNYEIYCAGPPVEPKPGTIPPTSPGAPGDYGGELANITLIDWPNDGGEPGVNEGELANMTIVDWPEAPGVPGVEGINGNTTLIDFPDSTGAGYTGDKPLLDFQENTGGPGGIGYAGNKPLLDFQDNNGVPGGSYVGNKPVIDFPENSGGSKQEGMGNIFLDFPKKPKGQDGGAVIAPPRNPETYVDADDIPILDLIEDGEQTPNKGQGAEELVAPTVNPDKSIDLGSMPILDLMPTSDESPNKNEGNGGGGVPPPHLVPLDDIPVLDLVGDDDGSPNKVQGEGAGGGAGPPLDSVNFMDLDNVPIIESMEKHGGGSGGVAAVARPNSDNGVQAGSASPEKPAMEVEQETDSFAGPMLDLLEETDVNRKTEGSAGEVGQNNQPGSGAAAAIVPADGGSVENKRSSVNSPPVQKPLMDFPEDIQGVGSNGAAGSATAGGGSDSSLLIPFIPEDGSNIVGSGIVPSIPTPADGDAARIKWSENQAPGEEPGNGVEQEHVYLKWPEDAETDPSSGVPNDQVYLKWPNEPVGPNYDPVYLKWPQEGESLRGAHASKRDAFLDAINPITNYERETPNGMHGYPYKRYVQNNPQGRNPAYADPYARDYVDTQNDYRAGNPYFINDLGNQYESGAEAQPYRRAEDPELFYSQSARSVHQPRSASAEYLTWPDKGTDPDHFYLNWPQQVPLQPNPGSGRPHPPSNSELPLIDFPDNGADPDQVYLNWPQQPPEQPHPSPGPPGPPSNLQAPFLDFPDYDPLPKPGNDLGDVLEPVIPVPDSPAPTMPVNNDPRQNVFLDWKPQNGYATTKPNPSPNPFPDSNIFLDWKPKSNPLQPPPPPNPNPATRVPVVVSEPNPKLDTFLDWKPKSSRHTTASPPNPSVSDIFLDWKPKSSQKPPPDEKPNANVFLDWKPKNDQNQGSDNDYILWKEDNLRQGRGVPNEGKIDFPGGTSSARGTSPVSYFRPGGKAEKYTQANEKPKPSTSGKSIKQLHPIQFQSKGHKMRSFKRESFKPNITNGSGVDDSSYPRFPKNSIMLGTEEPAKMNMKCPPQHNFSPVPNNCSYFYTCAPDSDAEDQLVMLLLQCRPQMHFDPKLQDCVAGGCLQLEFSRPAASAPKVLYSAIKIGTGRAEEFKVNCTGSKKMVAISGECRNYLFCSNIYGEWYVNKYQCPENSHFLESSGCVEGLCS